MNAAKREEEARAVAAFYAERGWDSSHVVAYILRRPEVAGVWATGAEAIAVERAGQLLREGWTAKHDEKHIKGEMALAGASYAICAATQVEHNRWEMAPCFIPKAWPWERAWWKPSADPIRNLVKAGALIAAEIDRLVRLEDKTPSLENQLEMPAVKTMSDTERLDLVEKLDASLTSDGGAGDGPSIWTMFWTVGNRNERIVLSATGKTVRAAIDKAARMERARLGGAAE